MELGRFRPEEIADKTAACLCAPDCKLLDIGIPGKQQVRPCCGDEVIGEVDKDEPFKEATKDLNKEMTRRRSQERGEPMD